MEFAYLLNTTALIFCTVLADQSKGIRPRLHELFHLGMAFISSRGDFLLGVWSFT